MYYAYIFLSQKSHIFYFGSTVDLKQRLVQHSSGLVQSTKAHVPWKSAWYGGFETEKEARNFEIYLKTGSGKAFACKRLSIIYLKTILQTAEYPMVLRSLRRSRHLRLHHTVAVP